MIMLLVQQSFLSISPPHLPELQLEMTKFKVFSQAKVTAQTVVSIEGFSLHFLALVLRSTAHA